MRTLVTGIIVFILWSALSTWYYINHVKGQVKGEEPPTIESLAETAPAAEDTATDMTEPETSLETPRSFTVYHRFDRSDIIPDPEFDIYIEDLVDYVDQISSSKLNVVGHTDNIGSEKYNYRLGMRRAQSTRDYFVKMGISDQIISISSEGESSPVATNETKTGRAQNRRTEIHINE